jgi:hypothetical protein
MLFLLVSHGMVQFVIFKIFQAKYRSEIIEMIINDITETDLVILKFDINQFNVSRNNIYWTEEDEFRFGNKMYDLIKKEITSDSVNLYCIYDENETELYSILTKYSQKLIANDPDTEEDLKELNMSLSQYYSKPVGIDYRRYISPDAKNFASFNQNLLDGEYFPCTPPPRS